MNNHLAEALAIFGTNKTDKSAREATTTAHRAALAEDYASQGQYLSAAHFEPNKDKAAEYDKLFWESLKPKN